MTEQMVRCPNWKTCNREEIDPMNSCLGHREPHARNKDCKKTDSCPACVPVAEPNATTELPEELRHWKNCPKECGERIDFCGSTIPTPVTDNLCGLMVCIPDCPQCLNEKWKKLYTQVIQQRDEMERQWIKAKDEASASTLGMSRLINATTELPEEEIKLVCKSLGCDSVCKPLCGQAANILLTQAIQQRDEALTKAEEYYQSLYDLGQKQGALVARIAELEVGERKWIRSLVKSAKIDYFSLSFDDQEFLQSLSAIVINELKAIKEITSLKEENKKLKNEAMEISLAYTELERYDIRQYIPEGKVCSDADVDMMDCRFAHYEMGDGWYCLVNRDVLEANFNQVYKCVACPKPYEEKE